MTESVVMVKFDEDCDNKVYPINWDELLTLDEMPLTDVAQPRMKLLAPWRTNKKDKVKYAPARVCTGDNDGQSAFIFEFLDCLVLTCAYYNHRYVGSQAS